MSIILYETMVFEERANKGANESALKNWN